MVKSATTKHHTWEIAIPVTFDDFLASTQMSCYYCTIALAVEKQTGLFPTVSNTFMVMSPTDFIRQRDFSPELSEYTGLQWLADQDTIDFIKALDRLEIDKEDFFPFTATYYFFNK